MGAPTVAPDGHQNNAARHGRNTVQKNAPQVLSMTIQDGNDMSTEHEQLILAAKACGLHFNPTLKLKQGLHVVRPDAKCQSDQVLWDPKNDDGDCARMEAQLDLAVIPYPIYDSPKHGVLVKLNAHTECANAEPPLRFCQNCTDPCQRKQPISKTELYADHAGDKNAARRAASVAVAAEIGRLM